MRLTRREQDPKDANYVPIRNGRRARMIGPTEWIAMPILAYATDLMSGLPAVMTDVASWVIGVRSLCPMLLWRVTLGRTF